MKLRKRIDGYINLCMHLKFNKECGAALFEVDEKEWPRLAYAMCEEETILRNISKAIGVAMSFYFKSYCDSHFFLNLDKENVETIRIREDLWRDVKMLCTQNKKFKKMCADRILQEPCPTLAETKKLPLILNQILWRMYHLTFSMLERTRKKTKIS